MNPTNINYSYSDQYSDYMELANYSPQTIKSYTSTINNFFSFVRINIGMNEGFMDYCRAYLLFLKRSDLSWSTINMKYSALKLFCTKILDDDWDIEELPRPKQEKKLIRILSQQEVGRLLETPSLLKHRTILYLFYATGIRISELVNLKLGDIDSDRLELFIRLGKGNKDRIVDIPSCVIPVLRSYYRLFKPKEYLFEGQSKTRKQYSKSSINKILSRARKTANITKRLTPHTLRHCYATHHLENGTDLVYIKEQLGHKDISTTEKYLHLCGEIRRQINHPIEELQIDILR